jgi:DNA mismatch endonuclease (patch repair protein)
MKLRSNVERDRMVDRVLAAAGWSVVRVWEHDVADEVGACLERVRAALASRG